MAFVICHGGWPWAQSGWVLFTFRWVPLSVSRVWAAGEGRHEGQTQRDGYTQCHRDRAGHCCCQPTSLHPTLKMDPRVSHTHARQVLCPVLRPSAATSVPR